MRAALDEFNVGAQSLKNFLGAAALEENLLKELTKHREVIGADEPIWSIQAALISGTVDQRLYTYSTAIIRLYGLFERYIEALIDSHLKQLTALTANYSDLPENIQKNHVGLTIDLLNGVGQDWYRWNSTQQSLIANLDSCLTPNGNYRLNVEAFVAHRSNFKIAQVLEQLGKIGLQGVLRKVLHAPSFKKYLEIERPELKIDQISDDDLKLVFSQVDDLARRRNEVAHGHLPDDIESIEILEKRVEFMVALVASLHDIAYYNILPLELQKPTAIALGLPIAVHNNSLVCFSLNNMRVASGDRLIAQTTYPNAPYKYGDIESIGVGENILNEITFTDAADCALKVSFKAKDNYEYFLMRA